MMDIIGLVAMVYIIGWAVFAFADKVRGDTMAEAFENNVTWFMRFFKKS